MGNTCCTESVSDADVVKEQSPMLLGKSRSPVGPDVKKQTPMARRSDVQVELLPPLPELHDFDGEEVDTEPRAELFEDPDFPATDDSIIGSGGGFYADSDLVDMCDFVVPNWARPYEMIGRAAGRKKLFGTEGEPCLFARTSPHDIDQGRLGDCWLLAAMSALAEYPDRVRSLFKQQTLAADGRYDVRLYDPTSEQWQILTIDDRLPFWQRPAKYGNLLLMKQTPENEFWPCLLEKAVAKFVKSYHRLHGGWSSTAFEMFTGKPSVPMRLGDVPGAVHDPRYFLQGPPGATSAQLKYATVYMRKDTYDEGWGFWTSNASSLVGGKSSFTDGELWNQMKDWDQKGYSQSCSSLRSNYKGIVGSHAYTVLKLLDISITRNGVNSVLKLIRVRNPWARGEWTGRFSDSDAETWNAYPEALAATGHRIGMKDDGAFWMEFDEFIRGFSYTTACFTENNGVHYTEHSGRPVAFGKIGYQKWDGLMR